MALSLTGHCSSEEGTSLQRSAFAPNWHHMLNTWTLSRRPKLDRPMVPADRRRPIALVALLALVCDLPVEQCKLPNSGWLYWISFRALRLIIDRLCRLQIRDHSSVTSELVGFWDFVNLLESEIRLANKVYLLRFYLLFSADASVCGGDPLALRFRCSEKRRVVWSCESNSH